MALISHRKKRYKDFFEIYVYVKTKAIVYYHLYVNVYVKRVYPHKTNNYMILFDFWCLTPLSAAIFQLYHGYQF